MAKRTITIWWVAGSIVMFVGFFGSFFVAAATNSGNPLNGQSAPLLFLSLIVAFSGVMLQLVAWIGALFNSYSLADKLWFHVLLWLGIVGIVTSPIVIGGLLWWALMLVYLIGAADGKAFPSTTGTPSKLAPTT